MKRLSLPGRNLPEAGKAQALQHRFALDLRGSGAAILTVILWASAFPGIRAALPHYSPFHVALLRYVTASIVLAIYALFTRMSLPAWRDLPRFALLGLLGIAFYNVALNGGEVRVPAAEASFLVASAPALMAVEAMFLLKERMRLWGWLGIAISCAGIAFITLSSTTSFQVDLWAVLVLSAAFAQSLYSIWQKALLSRYSAFECTAYAIWSGTIFLLIFSPGLLSEVRLAPFSATGAAIYLGIFPGALGYVSWAYALSRLSGSTAGSFLYLVPLVAVGLAWLWLGEIPAWLVLWGGLLVLAGVILVNTAKQRSATNGKRAENE
ncbi:DMT family transporter [Ktedonosporobacter rubrisoli]|uniref:DMT family transporter n=1 Tax=Ktedonosporobacter rubrisoli TaxID=2509675 RepID=A0A4P6JLS8_KTERU|nr:DMT family transporter [Ktedonosporobacter rubrisoli]QBD76217.1 DMT family transporter [Ktedonosporobacter rubrisoli]